MFHTIFLACWKFRYKVAKKTAKRAVSEIRGRMYDGLYQRLGTKEVEKDIYRMAKSRERRRETSSKLNALRMRQSEMKISRTGGGSILTNSSMKTVEARPLS
jgi:hypothetical protein